MKKKGNKKMPSPRHRSFITPSLHLCSALKCCLFVVNGLGKAKIFTSKWLHEIHCGLERNKDVGMGVMNESVSG